MEYYGVLFIDGDIFPLRLTARDNGDAAEQVEILAEETGAQYWTVDELSTIPNIQEVRDYFNE